MVTPDIALRSVLAAVDFDACSRHALRYAFRIAEAAGARLHVVHVRRPRMPGLAATTMVGPAGTGAPAPPAAALTPPPATPRLDDAPRADDEADTQRRLERFVEDARTSSAVEVTTEVRHTPLETVLTDEDLPFDLTVMGHHDRKWLERLLIGSEARRAVQVAPRPILVVPEPQSIQ